MRCRPPVTTVAPRGVAALLSTGHAPYGRNGSPTAGQQAATAAPPHPVCGARRARHARLGASASSPMNVRRGSWRRQREMDGHCRGGFIIASPAGAGAAQVNVHVLQTSSRPNLQRSTRSIPTLSIPMFQSSSSATSFQREAGPGAQWDRVCLDAEAQAGVGTRCSALSVGPRAAARRNGLHVTTRAAGVVRFRPLSVAGDLAAGQMGRGRAARGGQLTVARAAPLSPLCWRAWRGAAMRSCKDVSRTADIENYQSPPGTEQLCQNTNRNID